MDQQSERPPMYQTGLLHIRADRVIQTVLNQQLKPFHVSLTEWLLLGVVKDAPKDGITLSEIAKALDVSQPQVTALMDRVGRFNLVKQKVLRHDRRSRSVALSARGLRLIDQIEEALGVYWQEWFSKVPPKQIEAYMKTIERISKFDPED